MSTNNNRTNEEEKTPVNDNKSQNRNFKSILDIYQQKEIKNKHLTELISHLENFKKEIDESIQTKKTINNKKFKERLFNSLESLISEILYIENPQIQSEQIDSVYKWFTYTLNYYKSVLKLTIRTSNSPDEILTQDEINLNDREYQEKIEALFKQKDALIQHREILPRISKPSTLLKNYKFESVKQKSANQQNYIQELEQKKITSIYYIGEYANQKEKEQNFSSADMKSTFNSTKSMAHLFNHSINNMKPIYKVVDPSKEVKANFSYNQPEYNFYHLNLEKMLVLQRNRIMNEKRFQEEVRNNLNNFGESKARYKSTIQRAFEMKNLINLYSPNIKQEEPYEDEEKFKTVLDEIYTPGKELMRNNSMINLDYCKRNLSKIQSKDEEIKHPQRGNLMEMQHLNKGKMKVEFDFIRNLDKNNNIKKNKNEQMFDISMKVNQEEAKENLRKSFFEDLENLPSDLIVRERIKNELFNLRFSKAELCSIKNIDPKKTVYFQYFNPLSGYDSKNFRHFRNMCFLYDEKTHLKEKEGNKKKILNQTSVDYAKENFNSENFLQMRKIMSNFKDLELKKLKSTFTVNQRIVVNKSDQNKSKSTITNKALDSAFLDTSSNKIFPQFYLPRSSSGLLSLPENLNVTNKKKGREK